ncbi:hypothetical protein RF11_13241 [Thelohanellus kitauei]|uniref:FLYWCH-type domain-containing protein n=1 Tax=Thelohanellus kitauei TaxID=669202 RepID=A0A0C2MLZ0_THEKT|nr:hypothetical protein RF11_13241 [Thelohanellus kitauei]
MEKESDNSQNLKIIKTSKDKPCLIYEGYSYRKSKNSQQSQQLTWRCMKKYCNGGVKTNSLQKEIISVIGHHNHVVNPEENIKREIDNLIKKSALNTAETPRSIILNALRNCDASILARLPKVKSLERRIQITRKASNLKCKKTTDDQSSILPEEFKNTDNIGTNEK